MSRSLLLVSAVVALLALGASPAGAKSHGVFVNGDSLAVGTRPYLGGILSRWSVRTSASISRHAPEGAAVLRANQPLPRVLVISLGTNDDPRSTGAFHAAIRSIMAVAGPQRCVVWATIIRPAVAGATYAGYNAVLRREAKARANLRIARWVSLGRAHPDWFGSDGVHPGPTGYLARAREIAHQVRRCG